MHRAWSERLAAAVLFAAAGLFPAACERQPSRPTGPSAAVDPATGASGAAGGVDGAADRPADWCAEHGLPESVCTRCNPDLARAYRAAGDWCAEHGLPESHCTVCHPDLPRPRAAPPPAQPPVEPSETAADLRLEPIAPSLDPPNDPLCQVDRLRVRFADPSIVEKAGIRTAPAEIRRMSATIDLPAEVEFDPARVTHVTPRVPGVIREAPPNVGDAVGVGDLLAVIESPELGEAVSRYIERRESHALLAADLERAERIHQGTQRLLEVCRADAAPEDVRAQVAPAIVGDAKSRLLRAHAELWMARAALERQNVLAAQSAGTTQDLERARAALAAADAAFAALREEIALASERERFAAQRAECTARIARDAAERSLHLLGLSHEQIAALGGQSDESLSRYELRSPAPGRVVERHMAVGETVDASTALLTLADPSVVWLRMNARERDLPILRAGLPLLFTCDGLPGRGFEGRIAAISPGADPRTRTVHLRAELPNPDGLLRAGLFGNARIVVQENGQVLTVPRDAVQTDGCCQLVFVRRADDLFEPRKVTLGPDAAGFVHVVRGLNAGEVVATVGSFLMKTEVLKGNLGAGCCEVDPGR